jgi:hypothetical protein
MARFISLEDAARKLGISPEQLRERAQHREVRAFQDGGTWRFREEDIEELSRSLGMGSDPDLSLSDLDLDVPADSDLDMANFQLGVASPDPDRSSSQEIKAATGTGEGDVLLDDLTVPPELTGSSSTIIGMKPGGKQPSDSDVKLMPEGAARGVSDSDVRLAQPGFRRPSDSDVTLVSDDTGELPVFGGGSKRPAPAAQPPVGEDPNETTLRPSPLLGSSGEVPAAPADSDSDFELTPSSVIDALQPDSGSDFELTALDNSEEIATPPKRSPSDSDVTGALGSASGVNLGRPTDSGINLLGGVDFGSADSIELAPRDEESAETPKAPGRSAARPAPKATPRSEKADPGATALPVRAAGEKDIFEDTDFEVEAVGGGDREDRTMQLEATSDFDIDDAESGSEVFAVDEEEVDQNASTRLGEAPIGSDEFESSVDTETPSGDAWDVAEAEPAMASAASAAPAPRAVSPLVAGGAGPEWGTPWVVLLGLTSLLMLVGAFIGFDLIANFNEFRADGPASGLVKTIAGLFGK